MKVFLGVFAIISQVITIGICSSSSKGLIGAQVNKFGTHGNAIDVSGNLENLPFDIGALGKNGAVDVTIGPLSIRLLDGDAIAEIGQIVHHHHNKTTTTSSFTPIQLENVLKMIIKRITRRR